jgi:hypothetical protein
MIFWPMVCRASREGHRTSVILLRFELVRHREIGYTMAMTADAIFARLRRRPFVPFRLVLSSGTTYDIMHPEMLFVSKSGLTVAIYDRNQHPTPDTIPVRDALVSYLHVAATEDIPQPQAKAG